MYDYHKTRRPFLLHNVLITFHFKNHEMYRIRSTRLSPCGGYTSKMSQLFFTLDSSCLIWLAKQGCVHSGEALLRGSAAR